MGCCSKADIAQTSGLTARAICKYLTGGNPIQILGSVAVDIEGRVIEFVGDV
ncbi:MAG: hypothetical protein ACI4HQ_04580 [Acetatifactor sp.]